jgi:UTP-glucose-1-phosphate uridylyltransferase
MWGIIPAAGSGMRIQPLAFSKELLPVGSREDSSGEHPKAVSEYLVERLAIGGADKICFVISPGKSDIIQYFGARVGRADFAYVVQPRAAGLCDAIFRARPLVHPEEAVAIGLPDTIWFPQDGFHELSDFWRARGEADEYVGTLVTAWIAQGGEAIGVRAGEGYVDVGTLHGYREAIRLLSSSSGRSNRRAS